jgi:hypothetical protein
VTAKKWPAKLLDCAAILRDRLFQVPCLLSIIKDGCPLTVMIALYIDFRMLLAEALRPTSFLPPLHPDSES